MSWKESRIERTAALLIAAFICSNALGASHSPNEFTHDALFAPKPHYPYFENSYPFDKDTSGFDIEKAAFLAECSLLAYVKENSVIEEHLTRAGAIEITFFDEAGTFAILTSFENAMILVFRGTETGDQVDYLTDAKIIKKRFGQLGKAHSGFIDALEFVREDIDKAVDSADPNKSKPLWLAGHSLGAALATLYALRSERPVTGVYTIGAPRVGNKKLAASANDLKLYRIVHDNDIIPRLPSPPFYHHFGATYFITSSGKMLSEPILKDKWESRRKGHLLYLEKVFQKHWSNGEFNAIPSDYFADHSPFLYVEALKSLLEDND